MTMAMLAVLPLQYHSTYALVVWVEVLVGTISAMIAFVVLFLKPQLAPSAGSGRRLYGWLSICSVVIWCVWWVLVVMTHRGRG